MSRRAFEKYLVLPILLLLTLKWSINANKTVGDKASNPKRRGNIARINELPISFVQPNEQSWHAEEREHRRKERINWGLSTILTAVAAAGAIASVIMSTQTLKEATRSTGEAHRQANEAKRQADYAEQGAPRAWVYIDFKGGEPKLTKIPINGGLLNVVIEVPFSLQNFGSLPAKIESVSATMIIPADFLFPNEAPEDISNIGKHLNKKYTSSIKSDTDLFAYRPFEYLVGRTLLGNAASKAAETPFDGADFFFHAQNNLLVSVFPKQWIYVEVSYRDPFGLRKACTYRLARWDFPEVVGSRYNNCR